MRGLKRGVKWRNNNVRWFKGGVKTKLKHWSVGVMGCTVMYVKLDKGIIIFVCRGNDFPVS